MLCSLTHPFAPSFTICSTFTCFLHPSLSLCLQLPFVLLCLKLCCQHLTPLLLLSLCDTLLLTPSNDALLLTFLFFLSLPSSCSISLPPFPRNTSIILPLPPFFCTPPSYIFLNVFLSLLSIHSERWLYWFSLWWYCPRTTTGQKTSLTYPSVCVYSLCSYICVCECVQPEASLTFRSHR